MYADRYRKLLGLFFVIGWGVFSFISYQMLIKETREHNLAKVELIMSVANAVRSYTAENVKPDLEQHQTGALLAYAVPSFAAANVINRLPKRYEGYTYREVSLNPMNPKNRADEWEAELLLRLSSVTASAREIGERTIGQQRFVYIARPIRMTGDGCLSCHGRAENAPAQLLKVYGKNNGFGWNSGDVVAAQIGMVPMSRATSQIGKKFVGYLFSLAAFMLVLLVAMDQTLSHSKNSKRRFLKD